MKNGSLNSQVLSSLKKTLFKLQSFINQYHCEVWKNGKRRGFNNEQSRPIWRYTTMTFVWRIRRNKRKTVIAGNLAETATAYLPRYDPNSSVNTAIRTGYRIGVRFPAKEEIFMLVNALRMAMGSRQLRTTVSFMGVKRPECRPIHTLPSGDEV